MASSYEESANALRRYAAEDKQGTDAAPLADYLTSETPTTTTTATAASRPSLRFPSFRSLLW
jgi:hypothetical protein